MRTILFAAIAALCALSVGAQDELCKNPQASCGALITPECLQRAGAGSLTAGGSCADQFAGYQGCLASVVKQCGAPEPATTTTSNAAACSAEDARQLWVDLRESDDVDLLKSFVSDCAGTPQANLASIRIQRLEPEPKATTVPEPAQEPVAAPKPELEVDREAEAREVAQHQLHRDAQHELKRLGLYTSGIDGAWGPGSQRAMRAFQEQAGLAVNGVATEASLEILRAAPTPEQAGPLKPIAGQPPREENNEPRRNLPERVTVVSYSYFLGSRRTEFECSVPLRISLDTPNPMTVGADHCQKGAYLVLSRRGDQPDQLMWFYNATDEKNAWTAVGNVMADRAAVTARNNWEIHENGRLRAKAMFE